MRGFQLSRLSHWRWTPVLVVFGAGLLLTVFQNCGKAGFETMEQTNLELEKENIQSDLTPFAYEAALDQITYNSCASPGAAGKTFSFKAGAYEIQKPLSPTLPDVIKSGVRIKKDYITWAKTNLKPYYNPADPSNTQLTSDQAKSYLARSKRNERPQLQLSMRQIKNLSNVYSKSSSAVYGIDVIPLLRDLSDDRWLDPLMKKSFDVSGDTEFVHFFPLGSADNERIMEGALNFNSNEETAQAFRQEFTDKAAAQLALGFDDNLDPMTLRSPDTTSVSRAYGLGYRLNFQPGVTPTTQAMYGANAVVVPHIWNPSLILNGVTEINLETNKPSGRTWSCAETRRYIIVRKQDQPARCPRDHVNRMQDANYRREYEYVRRHFPAKDWDLSVDYRCLVPKTFSCYRDESLTAQSGGTSYGMVPVEYDISKPCFYNTNDSRAQYGNTPPTNYCVEVASFCLRN